MKKQKLTIDEQINHISEKGIQFNIHDKDYAKKFLLENTYYFKIKSYAKNYEQYLQGKDKGKYINLEFAYLVELSKIDMYLRRIILKITLDIEHFLKTQLLRDFQSNTSEDGYEIVQKLFNCYSYIEKNIENKSKNTASSDLVKKYRNSFAIWNIVEILSFNDFLKLYQLYYEKYPNNSSLQNHLWSVRMLRNAAAHNNCLINSLKTPYKYKIKPNKVVTQTISSIDGLSKTTRSKKMKNPVIHDFVVTLYVLNNLITSSDLKYNTMLELKNLMDIRIAKNKHYFEKNEIIKSNYNFCKEIIDYYYTTVVQCR